MASVMERIDRRLQDWLLAQPMFFVATAPRSVEGHVNLSPKGMAGTFAVLGPHRVAYLDYFGSGAETIAHLRDNGRIVLMCCAFSGPPKIVRLHGRGRVVLPDDPEFTTLRGEFTKDRTHGQRAIIVVDVERISDSCGFAVPQLEFVGDRDVLDRAQTRREPGYYEGPEAYARLRNATSIDGLPALG